MGSKKETNYCKSSGCRGACCTDMVFQNVTDKQLATLTPAGTDIVEVTVIGAKSHKERINNKRLHGKVVEDGPTKVYFAQVEENRNLVVVDGACPNLGQNGLCTIYENRPPHCNNFVAASIECTDTRKTSPRGNLGFEPNKPVFLGMIKSRPGIKKK